MIRESTTRWVVEYHDAGQWMESADSPFATLAGAVRNRRYMIEQVDHDARCVRIVRELLQRTIIAHQEGPEVNRTKEYEQALAQADQMGRDAGRAAASWRFDGSTDRATYVAFLQGLNDGDPAVMDAYGPAAWLSGEWADAPTPASLCADLGWSHDGHDDSVAAICDAYETAADNAYWDALAEVAQQQVTPERTTVYVAVTVEYDPAEVDPRNVLQPLADAINEWVCEQSMAPLVYRDPIVSHTIEGLTGGNVA